MHLVSDTLKSLESHDHTKQRFISQYLSSPGQSATYSLIKSCGAAFLKKLLSLSGSGLWVSEIKKRGGWKKKEKTEQEVTEMRKSENKSSNFDLSWLVMHLAGGNWKAQGECE